VRPALEPTTATELALGMPTRMPLRFLADGHFPNIID